MLRTRWEHVSLPYRQHVEMCGQMPVATMCRGLVGEMCHCHVDNTWKCVDKYHVVATLLVLRCHVAASWWPRDCVSWEIYKKNSKIRTIPEITQCCSVNEGMCAIARVRSEWHLWLLGSSATSFKVHYTSVLVFGDKPTFCRFSNATPIHIAFAVW